MSGVIRFLLNHRSESLMCVFVALILASPLGDSRPHVGGIMALLTLLVILAGASYMAERKIVLFVGLPAAGVWIIARILEAFGDARHFYTHLAPVAGLVLSCALLWAILGRFDSVPQVTSGVLSEAFISYLILATAFSQVYWILDHLVDHAFNEVIPTSHVSTFLYFSMVTLSSLGYGGIVPLNPYVRLVAALEGMTGIFYVAVVVARLVSSYRRQRRVEP
jgi:Ion channel